MKKNILVPGIFLSIFLLVIAYLYGLAIKKKSLPVQRVGTQDENRFYPIKSGIITYKVEGAHQGTIIHYFDDWGNQEAKYQDLSFDLLNGGSRDVKESSYFEDGTMYRTDDLIDRRMSSTALMSAAPVSQERSADVRVANKIELGSKGMDFGKLVGEENILGKVCNKYKKKNSTYWVWGGLVLKVLYENEVDDIIHIAIDIKENVPIPSDKLFPSDTESDASELLPPNP